MPRAFYSERHGRGPKHDPLSDSDLAELVVALFEEYQGKGYFQQAFGKDCVDSGWAPGTAGSDIGSFLFRKLRRRGLWPLRAHAAEFDRDTSFDLLELLTTVVSFPISGYMHGWDGCGMHYEEFDPERGRLEFISAANDVLKLDHPPLRMDDHGEIQQSPDEGFGQLEQAELPPTSDQDRVVARVKSAKHHFFKRDASHDDLRQAVRELADALEYLRGSIKVELLKGDDAAFFEIANRFHIRHNDPNQREAYDKPTWLRWTFYVYLATIHAIERIRHRQFILDGGGSEVH